MSEWFSLVHEKTGLSRWEQELSIRARQLELEDRDARLQHQIVGSGAVFLLALSLFFLVVKQRFY